MRFGVTHANLGAFCEPAAARSLAEAAQAHGFDSIWTVDHPALPVEYEPRYPETSDGRLPTPVDILLADPLVWLTYVADSAPELLLGTAVLLLPLRNTILTAKMAATVARLSTGRLRLGVGIGWMREEYEAIGVDFATRGRRLDEGIEVLRALWSGTPTSYHGRLHRFEGIIGQPAPAEPIPVVIGGYSPHAARRAGRLGDGFFPGGNDVERLEPLLAEMRRAALAAGRDPDRIEVTTRATDDLDHLRRLDQLGVHRVTLSARGMRPDDAAGQLRDFRQRVIVPYLAKRPSP